nr:MAG TPA: hypothetical protein [Caudoviricetes sp.]DAM91888.1 MAG TPA: hypothetical protein [Caudoviricetes sp.]
MTNVWGKVTSHITSYHFSGKIFFLVSQWSAGFFYISLSKIFLLRFLYIYILQPTLLTFRVTLK